MAEIRVLNSVGATVTIDGVERESVTVDAGTTVHWKVAKTGYVTQEDDYTVWEDTVLPVVLKREEYTITFNVTPTDATLTVNGSAVSLSGGKYTMTAKWGDAVSWSCEKDGYTPASGGFTADGDRTVNIALEAEAVSDRSAVRFSLLPVGCWLGLEGVDAVTGETIDDAADALPVDATTGRAYYDTSFGIGAVIEWTATCNGYVTQTGLVTCSEPDMTVMIDLVEEVELAIWFERDGKVIDTLNLDCSGDRIEVDIRTSRDDVMWTVDDNQNADWNGGRIYINPIQGTGSGTVTIYRDMNDNTELSVWSEGVMFHYGLTSSYELGTETLTVNRLECELDYVNYEKHSMEFKYDDYTAQTVQVRSNIVWTILTGIFEYNSVFDIAPTSSNGDAVMSISVTDEASPFIDITAGYNLSLIIGKTDKSVTDTLYIHVRGKEDLGEGISFLDGMEFKVDDQTEGNYTREHEISFRIRTWGGTTRMQFGGNNLWMSDLGGDWGLASVECNGQTLTADGEFSLEGETEYTVTVRWHNWHCRDNSEMGLPYGIELELNFNAHDPDGGWSPNEVRIYTTNGATGPYYI